jgi:hypothetical protein
MPVHPDPMLVDLFRIQDSWRHLPAYRLEPRADPFFALFLPEVLSKHVGKELNRVVVPEFPLRSSSLWPERAGESNHSVKADYAAFSADNQEVFLVELKTDQASRRTEQDEYLEAARSVGLHALVDGILSLCRSTQARSIPKYVHLLYRLAELGLVDVPERVYELGVPKALPGVKVALREVRNIVAADPPAIRIVYVQPDPDEHHDCISFSEFAAAIEHRGEMGEVFATYLRRWTERAGSVDPRNAV